MGRLGTAFRAFFGALGNLETADRLDQALRGPLPLPTPVEPPKPVAPPKPAVPPPPTQNPAVTLLATLQREARLIDFLKEDLAAYADDQIGAAVREVQRDAAKTLERLFAIRPILSDAEGARVTVPAGFEGGRYRLTGQVSGTPPHAGTVRHQGWEVTTTALPTYTGNAAAASTIAPAEVEIGA
jgi:hypothetical protein